MEMAVTRAIDFLLSFLLRFGFWGAFVGNNFGVSNFENVPLPPRIAVTASTEGRLYVVFAVTQSLVDSK